MGRKEVRKIENGLQCKASLDARKDEMSQDHICSMPKTTKARPTSGACRSSRCPRSSSSTTSSRTTPACTSSTDSPLSYRLDRSFDPHHHHRDPTTTISPHPSFTCMSDTVPAQIFRLMLHPQGWVASAFVLAQTVFLLFYGQVLRIVPAKWVLLSAIAIFEAGSLVCGVSQNVGQLIAGRTVSGLGAAGICACFFCVLRGTRTNLPLSRRYDSDHLASYAS